MKSNIARIYKREFTSQIDAQEFINAVGLISERLTAVDVKYRLHQCDDNPLIIFEIWEYPDEDAMEWVQASMEGASAVPRKFSPKTDVWSTTVRTAIDIEE